MITRKVPDRVAGANGRGPFGMGGPPLIRFVFVGLICVPVYVLLGFLAGSAIHTGPHDWFMLPGITIEHYYGHGVRVEEVRPYMLLPALAVSYAIAWCIFPWASEYGKKRSS